MLFMRLFKSKVATIIILLVVILLIAFGVQQFFTLQLAHSTFDNYYAFRGCTHLIKRTNDYGLCKIASGQIIKIVKFQGKWYLDGDLPVCILNICL
jgi:hypothetical protein